MSIEVAAGVAIQLLVNQTMPQGKCDILKLAQQFLAERYPFIQVAGSRPIISEEGNLLELSYRLPQGTLGFEPTVTIDKRICTVIHAHVEQ